MDTKYYMFLLTLFGAMSTVKLQCKESETELRCADQNLDSIPKISVQNKIEMLDMSQNELEELFGVDFAEYYNLTNLYLSENSISYIEDDTFEHLLKLQFIDLSKNLLEEIPDNLIINNKNLSVLDLSENLFQSQPPTLISESLEVLNLSQCKITFFYNDSISNLPNLRLLYLNSNNLVSLDDRMFSIPKLFYYVDIDFNPWECSCNSVKMLERLTNKQLFEITHPIHCVNDKKSQLNIYDKDGPKICEKKQKILEKSTIMSNSIEQDNYTEDNINDNEIEDTPNYQQISHDIKHLEEILKNEKMYFMELTKEKDMLDSVTMWSVKIFMLVILLSGIALGVLISAFMNKSVRRFKSQPLLKSEPI